MYQVVLVEPQLHNVIGDLGFFDDPEEAYAEVISYNKKSDRHRGYAMLQLRKNGRLIGDEDEESSSEDSEQFEEMEEIEESFQPSQRPIIQRQLSSRENPRPVSMHRRPLMRSHQQHQRRANPSYEQYLLLEDTRTGRPFVLSDAKYNQMYGYKILDQGTFDQMINRRNQMLRGVRLNPFDPETGKQLSYGAVVVDGEDKVLLVRVAGQYSNTMWTLPKGKQDDNETPEEAAIREALEETGWKIEIVGPIRGKYKGQASLTQYFLAAPINKQQDFDSAETEQIGFFDFDMAVRLLGESGTKLNNYKTSQRDIEALIDAYEMLGCTFNHKS
jgi:ADP-ribose pyrophosphatase YjhB (NUDIX family)